MKKTLKIGWQKYEDVLESQINSPIVDKIHKAIFKRQVSNELNDNFDDSLENNYEEFLEQNNEQSIIVDNNLANELALAVNFDCWIGYTNFNITLDIKNELDKIEGVELLKVFTRYRFLIGVGHMFTFSDVRKRIEELCMKE